jgi:hypothetical protein
MLQRPASSEPRVIFMASRSATRNIDLSSLKLEADRLLQPLGTG